MKKEFTSKAEAEEFYDKLRAENKYEFDAYMLDGDKGYGLQWIESKKYIAHDGQEFKDEVWLTEAGDLVLVQDLSEAHARNILRMMIRKDRAAFELVTNLMSSGALSNGDDEDLGMEDAEVPQTLH